MSYLNGSWNGSCQVTTAPISDYLVIPKASEFKFLNLTTFEKTTLSKAPIYTSDYDILNNRIYYWSSAEVAYSDLVTGAYEILTLPPSFQSIKVKIVGNSLYILGYNGYEDTTKLLKFDGAVVSELFSFGSVGAAGMTSYGSKLYMSLWDGANSLGEIQEYDTQSQIPPHVVVQGSTLFFNISMSDKYLVFIHDSGGKISKFDTELGGSISTIHIGFVKKWGLRIRFWISASST